jgi:hypothetical protein
MSPQDACVAVLFVGMEPQGCQPLSADCRMIERHYVTRLWTANSYVFIERLAC